jgi:aspartate racemase
MIGVLGGMGPESTAYTYLRMIRYCQEKYKAKLDEDFPPILIFSMPVPDVVESGADDVEILQLLNTGIEKLEKAGADFSIIPCNSMQGFIPDLRKEFKILSIVDETLKEARKTRIRKWGILATEVTISKGYFQNAFAESGLEIIQPDPKNQDMVTKAIRSILAGTEMESARKILLKVNGYLKSQGAEGIILACTDLPIVLNQDVIGLRTLDTADIIARAAIDYYKKLKE